MIFFCLVGLTLFCYLNHATSTGRVCAHQLYTLRVRGTLCTREMDTSKSNCLEVWCRSSGTWESSLLRSCPRQSHHQPEWICQWCPMMGNSEASNCRQRKCLPMPWSQISTERLLLHGKLLFEIFFYTFSLIKWADCRLILIVISSKEHVSVFSWQMLDDFEECSSEQSSWLHRHIMLALVLKFRVIYFFFCTVKFYLSSAHRNIFFLLFSPHLKSTFICLFPLKKVRLFWLHLG